MLYDALMQIKPHVGKPCCCKQKCRALSSPCKIRLSYFSASRDIYQKQFMYNPVSADISAVLLLINLKKNNLIAAYYFTRFLLF